MLFLQRVSPTKQLFMYLVFLSFLLCLSVIFTLNKSYLHNEKTSTSFHFIPVSLQHEHEKEYTILQFLESRMIGRNTDTLSHIGKLHNRNYYELLEKGFKPSGDTIFMRRPFLLTEQNIATEIERDFRLASLADDKAIQVKILNSIVSHSSLPVVQYRALLGLAKTYLIEKDFSKAEQMAKQALDSSVPEQWKADAYFLLAQSYILAGKQNIAIPILQKSIQADPVSIHAHQTYIGLLQADLADSQCNSKTLEKMFMKSIESLEALGAMSGKTGEFMDIAENLKKYKGNSPIKQFTIGYMYYLAGDHIKSLKYMEALSSSEPNNSCENIITASQKLKQNILLRRLN